MTRKVFFFVFFGVSVKRKNFLNHKTNNPRNPDRPFEPPNGMRPSKRENDRLLINTPTRSHSARNI